MTGDRTYIEYVAGSSVRSDVVLAVAGGTDTMEGLLAEIDASESAVYGAVSELRGKGLLTDPDDFRLTGIGEIVADALERLEATDALLSGDTDYWRTHCVDVLPCRFRAELSALAGCDVIRATETDPHRAVRTVARRLEEAESAAIATPIYQEEYAMQLPDVSDLRLLLNRAVVEDASADAIEGGIEPPADADIRVGDVGFALTVTDEVVMLSLPKIDGGYDTQSELFAEHERALDWGQRLYEHCWERARPVEEFVS
jgi:predicted transcriptional regulator